MTYTKKKILPALHQSDKVSKPDLQKIGDQNYTDTILRYGNLAVKFPQLETNAKTIVDAINELNRVKSTVIPNPPGEEPTDTLNTVKIDGTVFNIEGGGGGTGVSGYDIKHYVGTNSTKITQNWDVEEINTFINKDSTNYQAIEFPLCTTDQFKFKNDTDVKIDTELNLDIYIPWAIILSNGNEPFKDINFGYELRQYVVDENNQETRIADYAPQEFLFEDAVQFRNDYSVYGGTQYTLSDRSIAGYNIREYFGEFSFCGGVTARGRRQGGEIIQWDYYHGVNDALIWTYYFYKTPYSEYDYYDTKHYSYWLSSDYYGRSEEDTSKAIPAKRFELFRLDGGDTIPGIIAHDPIIYKLDVQIPVSWHLVDNAYNEPNHKPITCYYQLFFQYSDDNGETWFDLNPASYYGDYPTYMWEWKGTPENPEPEKRETISYTWFIDKYHLPIDDTKGFILRGDILVSAVPQDTYDANSFPCELHFGILPEALVTFTVVDAIDYNKESDHDVLVYTQTFYTDAPDENGESITICEINAEDLPEGNFFNISINCEPETGIYIGYHYVSENTYRIYCQDYVPEGTPIKINYLYYEEGGSGSGSGSGSDESVSGSCVPEDTFPGHLNLTISRDFYKLLQKSNQYILPNTNYRVKTALAITAGGQSIRDVYAVIRPSRATTIVEGYDEIRNGGGGGGSGVEYYPGRGIFFSDEITEEFYTEAPQESGSGAGLSYTTCPLKYKADTTYGNPVTICHPIRGSLFGGVYDSTTNSVLVTCRDYVPEGTLIQIKYTANIAEANSINADAGRRSSAYTYIQFRTDYMSPKNSWKSTGTYIDGNLVQVSQAITDPPYRCFSWGQLEITGIQDITLYVKQDSINTNTAYILISKPGKTFRVKTTDTFNGDGVTNVFTLSHEIYRPAMAPYVTFEPSGSFPNTVSGNTITFTGTIPPVGTKISVQYYCMDTSSNRVFKSYKGVTTSDYDSCYISLGGGSSDYYQRVVDILYVKDGDATISNSVAYFYYEAGTAYIGANGEIFNDYNNNYAIGFQSHAEGGSSLAMGNRSHAEGMSKAVGSFSHSEGEDTTALGGNSHAEGEETIASGTSSHSEGELTLASGANSHAEGTHTQALGNHSHSEGGSTYAEGMYSHSEGIWTHATGDASHAEGDSTRALSSSAHTEGILTIAEGAYSHAEGSSTKASGGSSHAEGNYTRALGYTSHAEGNYSQATAQYSHAEGSYTVASNYYAHAEGNSTTASGGDGAHAEGNTTVASGSSAHAEGTHTTASGAGSHAGGGYSVASGQYAYAMGDNTTASGDYSHAEGQTTVASGTRSHAEGWNTTASEASAHAEGDSTTASSSYAHAEGQNSVASNAAAHAEGDSSTASGYASHAEGVHTQATGAGSHAEGYSDVGAEIVASGRGAHAEGFMTSAVGMASHAEGGGTKALGQESHAEGGGTVAYGNWSHVEGAGNTAYAYYSHVEGAGTKSFETFTHVEGAGNKNIAQYSHLEGGGNSTTSSAHMSHTEGAGNTNYGHQSHIEGSGNRVSGEESHVEGAGNQVHGPKTHAEGGGNTAYTIGSHVEGKHNFIAGFGVHAEGSFNCIGSTASVPQFSYGTTYAIGDIVGVNDNYAKHGNELTDPLLFRCITAPGQIQAGTGIEIVAADSWDSSTTYPANSVVKFTDGSTGYYRNSSEVSAGGNPPPANSSWQKISQILSPMVGRSGANTRFTYAYGNGQYTGWWLNGNDTAQTIVSVTVDGVATSATLEQGGRIIRLPFAPANGAYVIMEYYVVQAYEYSYYLLDVDNELGYDNPVAKVQNIVSISPMWEAVATPKYTHIEGFYNIALGDYQHVGGKFNSADANKAVIVGNGADGNNRANAYTLDWNGNATFAGDITLGTTLSTTAQTVAAAINEMYSELGSEVSVSQIQHSGTKIAEITVDGSVTELFAPNGGGGGSTVVVDPVVQSGVNIADITVDGTLTHLYTPDAVGSVTVDDTLSTGTKVATITIDGVDTEILVPSAGSSVQVTQIQESGTHIADIEVDGVTTELYAPNAGGAIIDDNDIALDKTWSSYKINEMFFELAQKVAAIERYLWGQPVLTEDGDNRVTEDGTQRILEENEE